MAATHQSSEILFKIKKKRKNEFFKKNFGIRVMMMMMMNL